MVCIWALRPTHTPVEELLEYFRMGVTLHYQRTYVRTYSQIASMSDGRPTRPRTAASPSWARAEIRTSVYLLGVDSVPTSNPVVLQIWGVGWDELIICSRKVETSARSRNIKSRGSKNRASSYIVGGSTWENLSVVRRVLVLLLFLLCRATSVRFRVMGISAVESNLANRSDTWWWWSLFVVVFSIRNGNKRIKSIYFGR